MKKGLDIYLQDIIESIELIQRRMQNVSLEAFEGNGNEPVEMWIQ